MESRQAVRASHVSLVLRGSAGFGFCSWELEPMPLYSGLLGGTGGAVRLLTPIFLASSPCSLSCPRMDLFSRCFLGPRSTPSLSGAGQGRPACWRFVPFPRD